MTICNKNQICLIQMKQKTKKLPHSDYDTEKNNRIYPIQMILQEKINTICNIRLTIQKKNTI